MKPGFLAEIRVMPRNIRNSISVVGAAILLIIVAIGYNNCGQPQAGTNRTSTFQSNRGFMIPTYTPNVELRFCFHTVRHNQVYTDRNGQIQKGGIPSSHAPVMVTVNPAGTDLPDPNMRIEGTFDSLSVDLSPTPGNPGFGACPELISVQVKNSYGDFVVEGRALELAFEGPYSISGGTGTLAVESSQIQLNMGAISEGLAEARSADDVIRVIEEARGTVTIFRL